MSKIAHITSRPRLVTTLTPADLPPVFAMPTEGTCLEPVFKNGCKLIFSRDETYRPGDFVMLMLKPEHTPVGSHQCQVKRMVLSTVPKAFWSTGGRGNSNLQGVVLVEMLNPRKLLRFDPNHLLGVFKCLGEPTAGTRVVKCSDEEIRLAARLRGGSAT